MAHRTKLFRNGGSQAVRLPRDCRFPDEQQEVVVRREGRRVVIEPLDVWPTEFLACIGGWRDEIPTPKQTASMKGRDPFA